MIIIDANESILGRLATHVAKLALTGEQVNVVNCENALITGDKKTVFEKFKQRLNFGAPLVGPYYPKQSNLIVRRTIRGMLPYKQDKGVKAFKNVKCYIGVPSQFADQKAIVIDKASIKHSQAPRYVRLGDIAPLIGGKQ